VANKIHVNKITEAIREMVIESNYVLSEDVKGKITTLAQEEDWPLAKQLLQDIIDNYKIAEEERVPICQDTGMAVVFLQIGQGVQFVGGNLIEAINEGVRQGYQLGYLRKSVVSDPLNRINTGDNTPAVIHTEIIEGDKVHLTVAPKGFGSENMSRIKMLKPAEGREGVIDFVLETVKLAGSNPCPPIIVGVGIGGTMEKAAILAKKAAIRSLDKPNSNQYYRQLEKELLEKVNGLGVGPQGFGGKTTALGVNIEYYPTHIAGLPVAVNINCHVARHISKVID
jgi:fumarate hydratase subunit alpha